MTINYIKGDATEPIIKDGIRIILHVVNSSGGWGSGFVLALSKKWKLPEQNYRNWHKNKVGFTLGNCQFVNIAETKECLFKPPIIVVNMLAQEGYKTKDNTVPLRYVALENCLYNVAEKINDMVSQGSKVTIHAPFFGVGLAGGNWNKIEKLINKCLPNITIYIYEWDKK